jgi:hypothetical protein
MSKVSMTKILSPSAFPSPLSGEGKFWLFGYWVIGIYLEFKIWDLELL